MRKQVIFEGVVIASLIGSTIFTLFVEPGVPDTRTWLLGVGLISIGAGIFGVIARIRGRGRIAGAFYLVAAAAPNALYLINIVVLGMAFAALLAINVDATSHRVLAVPDGSGSRSESN